MSETKISTVLSTRVSLETANDAYRFASEHHTTVALILKQGLDLAKKEILGGQAVFTESTTVIEGDKNR
jgi:hypothetical protein